MTEPSGLYDCGQQDAVTMTTEKLIEILRAQQSYLADRAVEEIERLTMEVARLQEALRTKPDIVMQHKDIRA